MMEREQLEKMTLQALRILAAEQGVEGAASLGKAQLIEQLLPPPTLLAGAKEAVEKVVHKVEEKAGKATRGSAPPEPTAGKPSRGKPSRPSFDIPSSTVHPHADELETLTMARLYLAEGQIERALEIFEKLSALDPEDQELSLQVAELREKLPKPAQPAPPPAPAPPNEPLWMLDLEELPETYGLDECEVLYKDPFWVFAYWEVTENGLNGARAQLGPSAGSSKLVLRLFTTVAQPSGVERHIQDIDLPWNHGRRYLQPPKPGAHLRIAVGLLSAEGYFAPIAHSSLVRVPSADPSEGPVEWMEVLAGRSRGRERESLVIVRRGADHSERALGAQPSSSPATFSEQAGTSRGKWNPTGSGSGGVK